MLNILASGTLVADPRRRTSAAGKDYATASLRVPAEDADPMLVSVIAFNADAVAAILALQRGDSCAIAGYSHVGARAHAARLVADGSVRAEIDRRRAKVVEAAQEKTGVTVAGVLQELRGIRKMCIEKIRTSMLVNALETHVLKDKKCSFPK